MDRVRFLITENKVIQTRAKEENPNLRHIPRILFTRTDPKNGCGVCSYIPGGGVKHSDDEKGYYLAPHDLFVWIKLRKLQPSVFISRVLNNITVFIRKLEVGNMFLILSISYFLKKIRVITSYRPTCLQWMTLN